MPYIEILSPNIYSLGNRQVKGPFRGEVTELEADLLITSIIPFRFIKKAELDAPLVEQVEVINTKIEEPIVEQVEVINTKIEESTTKEKKTRAPRKKKEVQ